MYNSFGVYSLRPIKAGGSIAGNLYFSAFGLVVEFENMVDFMAISCPLKSENKFQAACGACELFWPWLDLEYKF